MHTIKPEPHQPATVDTAAQAVLREAKRLHKAASCEQLSLSLPVLRRLISSNTLHGMSLPELHRQRGMVQRKHILRMLAVEAGFISWEAYRPALAIMSPDQLGHFEMARRQAGYPNFWFSSMAEAQAHVKEKGGLAFRVGQQAVVFAHRDSA